MTTRSRFFASNCGSAEMPSRSGISISSMTTSGSARSTWLTASRPVRSEAATTISGSASIQRANSPRMTTASSTIMTRSGSCRVECRRSQNLLDAILITHRIRLQAARRNDNAEGRQPPDRTRRSDQSDFLELGLDDLLVERLHDVLVGAGMQRASNMRDVVFGGAEHHLRADRRRVVGAASAEIRSRPFSACSSRAELLPAMRWQTSSACSPSSASTI